MTPNSFCVDAQRIQSEGGPGCSISEYFQWHCFCSSSSMSLLLEYVSFLKVIKTCSCMCRWHISSFGLGYLLFSFLPGIPLNFCRDCSWRTSVCLQKMRVGAGGVEVTIFTPRQETKLFLQSDSIQLTLLLSSSYCRLVWITSVLVLLRHFLVVLSPVTTQVTDTGETTVETLQTAAGLTYRTMFQDH